MRVNPYGAVGKADYSQVGCWRPEVPGGRRRPFTGLETDLVASNEPCDRYGDSGSASNAVVQPPLSAVGGDDDQDDDPEEDLVVTLLEALPGQDRGQLREEQGAKHRAGVA